MTIHAELRRSRRFTEVRDRLTESTHRQSKLRNAIFNNILSVYANSFEVTAEQDAMLAERAWIALELHVPRLYKWFRFKSSTFHINPIRCTRSEEEPKLKRVAFEVNLPTCKKGNKHCCVESYIRRMRPVLISQLENHSFDSEQLTKAIDEVRAIIADPPLNFQTETVEEIGDLLITLETKPTATHVLSTNKRDWQPLCECSGMQLVPISHSAT